MRGMLSLPERGRKTAQVKSSFSAQAEFPFAAPVRRYPVMGMQPTAFIVGNWRHIYAQLRFCTTSMHTFSIGPRQKMSRGALTTPSIQPVVNTGC